MNNQGHINALSAIMSDIFGSAGTIHQGSGWCAFFFDSRHGVSKTRSFQCADAMAREMRSLLARGKRVTIPPAERAALLSRIDGWLAVSP